MDDRGRAWCSCEPQNLNACRAYRRCQCRSPTYKCRLSTALLPKWAKRHSSENDFSSANQNSKEIVYKIYMRLCLVSEMEISCSVYSALHICVTYTNSFFSFFFAQKLKFLKKVEILPPGWFCTEREWYKTRAVLTVKSIRLKRPEGVTFTRSSTGI